MGAPKDVRIARFGNGIVVVSWEHARATAGALTPAEEDVLALAVSGLGNDAIAARRQCSVRTVANLLGRAYRKLGVSSRAEAAAALLFTSREEQ